MSSGFTLMLLVALWEKKTCFDLQTGQPWEVTKTVRTGLCKAGLVKTRSWDMYEMHHTSSVPKAPSSTHCSAWAATAGATQRAQGAVGDPPEKQPGLSMFPSRCSALLSLKWGVITVPAIAPGPFPDKWKYVHFYHPRTPVIWLWLKLFTLFDAGHRGRAANSAIAAVSQMNTWLQPVLICWTNQMKKKNSIWIELVVTIITLKGKTNILLQPLP